ncbi:hypothetical protein B7P43_G10824 [Cryptotermes secundus]|uniref:Uncharacterized protein n=1 Tax=Cryptotermes secundus TaxID=105785 RepID=A0A2J7PIW8_9NEOP|nr:hypothetical protein B7P43_G10824 [Cryptotermes secundus]
MCATGSECPQAFFLAGDTSLLQEGANGKINVQSACALNTVYDLKLQHDCDFRFTIKIKAQSFPIVTKIEPAVYDGCKTHHEWVL